MYLLLKTSSSEYFCLYCPTEVPLKSVDVTVTARGFVADVAAELAYVNSEAQAVEIEYVFPIDAGWSVYRFSAEIDGKVINAELQEKKQVGSWAMTSCFWEFGNITVLSIDQFVLEFLSGVSR